MALQVTPWRLMTGAFNGFYSSQQVSASVSQVQLTGFIVTFKMQVLSSASSFSPVCHSNLVLEGHAKKINDYTTQKTICHPTKW